MKGKGKGKGKETKIAITIDWDFFVDTDKYDFGHRENSFFINDMWSLRLTGNPGLIDEFKRSIKHFKIFWPGLKELEIHPFALYVSDSHCFAASFFATVVKANLLINFDSHHDLCNRKEDFITCENWALKLLEYRRNLRYLWVSPPWASKSNPSLFSLPESIRNRIEQCSWEDLPLHLPERKRSLMGHVCRSGAWMPPWLDEDFDSFIKSAEVTIMPCSKDFPAPRTFRIPTEEEKKANKEAREKVSGKVFFTSSPSMKSDCFLSLFHKERHGEEKE